jgi:hypothetical protein
LVQAVRHPVDASQIIDLAAGVGCRYKVALILRKSPKTDSFSSQTSSPSFSIGTAACISIAGQVDVASLNLVLLIVTLPS